MKTKAISKSLLNIREIPNFRIVKKSGDRHPRPQINQSGVIPKAQNTSVKLLRDYRERQDISQKNKELFSLNSIIIYGL